MKQFRVELTIRDRQRRGESRKAFRRRMKPAVIGMRQDARERSRAAQRAGRPAERCVVRAEAVTDWRDRANKKLWRRAVRASALATGRVGAVEWIVAPGGGMPSLNGYLVLPNGHPWLTPHDDYDELSFDYGGGAEHAPREYTYRRGAWIGVDSGHYNDAWNNDELRARVKPFPERWDRVLAILPDWPLPSTMTDPYTTHWTVDAWTAAVHEWARAAAEATRG